MPCHRFALRALPFAAFALALSTTPCLAIDKLPPMVALGAGAASACTLNAAGVVRCWGQNSLAVLDASGTLIEPSAVLGGGLTSGVAQIAVGSFHRCAILAGSGALKCWGANGTGAVGDGSTTDRPVATDVVGLSGGVTGVAAGNGFSCAVTNAGGVKCWGRNTYGQLGDGSTATRTSPVDVTGIASGAIAVAAGGDHACAILATSALKCWGRNDSGQLGNGSLASSPAPVAVTGLGFGVSVVSLGTDHSCAIGPNSALLCWGSGQNGKIGDGAAATTPRTTPTAVAGLPSGVSTVAAGATHTCASAGSSRQVKCWGTNLNFRIGDAPATLASAAPVDIPGQINVGVLAGGNGFACSLAGNGRVQCWGDNSLGQLGTGTLALPYVPSDVVDQEAILSVTTSGTGGGQVLPIPGASGGTNSGYPIQVAAVANYGSTFTGWGAGACSGVTASICNLVMAAPVNTGGVTMPGTTSVSAIFDATPTAAGLQLTPATNSFPGAVVGTTGATVTLTLSNASTYPATVGATTATGDFTVAASSCGSTLQPAASCTFLVTFSPTGLGTRTGTFTLASNTTFGPRTVSLAGTGLPGSKADNVNAVIAGYYEKILGRTPDPAGAAFWASEVSRLSALGASVNEVFFAMAYAFFNSPDYASGNTSDVRFVTDLYRTFFLRDPDAGGLAYWTGQLQIGKPRGAVLNDFLFSGEFTTFMSGLFGAATTSRAEVSMVMDFYRGSFDRLPDNAGFLFWLARFRAAQCGGAASVVSEADIMSAEFIASPEYSARQAALPVQARASAAVVNLYNMVLRRGGDFAGFRFWVDQVTTPGSGLDFVRRSFVGSPEFGTRVNAVIAQGCLT
jgi:alpha-tubulin suppressor-like RCC1 family protein